jgi:predicted TIM-barrel fold metal-dependent hydrolase
VRLGVMDEQGVDRVWMFPTLGMIYEEPLKHDPEAVGLLFRAFNRWLCEDWGFNFRDRIYAAPYITLVDPAGAAAELEWALGQGARLVCMRPAAPTTERGQLPPGHQTFDAFWARADEAGITVAVHAGDSGQSFNGYAPEGWSAVIDNALSRPTIKQFTLERAIHDFLASLLCDGLFDRFPNLRLASVENGSEFLPELFRKLRTLARRYPGHFTEDPVETFQRHVWINPFFEDDITEVVELMGHDRVIFGSDWPHQEGLPTPLDYTAELTPFSNDVRQRIMRDNAAELTTVRPR